MTIHAVNDPNTEVVEKTECNFQCQEGYFDEEKGDTKIPFKCVPDSDRTKATGVTQIAPTACSGACVTCVVAVFTVLYYGPLVGCVSISSSITLVLLLISLNRVPAAQTCTVTKTTIESLNIEAGGCNTANKQSTADVTIHAINDPNTEVVERTECNFQCQEGYFNKTIGDEIPFKCTPNPDRTQQSGITQAAPKGCQGAFVMPWPSPLHCVRPNGCSPLTPHLFFQPHYFLTLYCSANMYSGNQDDRKPQY